MLDFSFESLDSDVRSCLAEEGAGIHFLRLVVHAHSRCNGTGVDLYGVMGGMVKFEDGGTYLPLCI